jgi:hypothetical protein
MILAAAGFAMSLGSGARLLKPEVIDAKTVVAETLALRNASGDIVARMGITADGAPSIAFFDKDRNLRLVVGLRADGGPSVSLVDPQQAPRAVLSLNDKQEPALTLFNAAKLPRVVVSAGGGLELYDGRPRPAPRDGAPQDTPAPK